MIKAVIIGFAHMHVNEIAEYVYSQPDFELIGCADVPATVPEKTTARYTRAWNLKKPLPVGKAANSPSASPMARPPFT